MFQVIRLEVLPKINNRLTCNSIKYINIQLFDIQTYYSFSIHDYSIFLLNACLILSLSHPSYQSLNLNYIDIKIFILFNKSLFYLLLPMLIMFLMTLFQMYIDWVSLLMLTIIPLNDLFLHLSFNKLISIFLFIKYNHLYSSLDYIDFLFNI